MELRHDACHNESRDRHHRRWESVSVEMSDNVRGAYHTAKNSKDGMSNVEICPPTPLRPELRLKIYEA